jgi:hypothetical protein
MRNSKLMWRTRPTSKMSNQAEADKEPAEEAEMEDCTDISQSLFHQELTENDWADVCEFYQHTGRPSDPGV